MTSPAPRTLQIPTAGQNRPISVDEATVVLDYTELILTQVARSLARDFPVVYSLSSVDAALIVRQLLLLSQVRELLADWPRLSPIKERGVLVGRVFHVRERAQALVNVCIDHLCSQENRHSPSPW